MSPAFVFVVLATGINEHTITTEVRGVFAHMHQTTSLVRQIKADGQQALVTKHHVQGIVDEPAMQTSWLPGGQPRCHGSGWRDGSCTHGQTAGVQ